LNKGSATNCMIVSVRIAMQGLDERLSKVWVTYEHTSQHL
jgi:hypothetical protein